MNRLHELDALRAFWMLLGVVLHAAVLMFPGDWPEEYIESSMPGLYDEIFHFIHGFRMQVFFMLSGFFAMLLWNRRGTKEMIKHRLIRIGIPLAFGALTIIPLDAMLVAVFILDYEFTWMRWMTTWTRSLSILWYLWYLLMLAGILLVATALGFRFNRPKIWWALLLVPIVPQFLMEIHTFGPVTPLGLKPDPVSLIYYAAFFFLGVHLYQHSIAIKRQWAWALIPGLLILLPGIALDQGADTDAEKWASAIVEVAYAWLMCFGLMGMFRIVASSENRWIRYMSDASYWIYLWHFAVVMTLIGISDAWGIPSAIRFAAICIATPVILLVPYQLAVRYTLIGTVLNGRKTRNKPSKPAHHSKPLTP